MMTCVCGHVEAQHFAVRCVLFEDDEESNEPVAMACDTCDCGDFQAA